MKSEKLLGVQNHRGSKVAKHGGSPCFSQKTSLRFISYEKLAIIDKVTMAGLLGGDFLLAAQGTLHRGDVLTHGQFATIFGCSGVIAASLWRKMDREELLPEGARPHHLLWALAFLKVYGTENTMCYLFKTSRKTWREWVWPMIDALFYIDLVR